MKTKNVFGLIVTTLFCASMAACVGATDPEGGGDMSTPANEEGPRETTQAYCPNCHVYCSGNGKYVVGYRGPHSDCTAEGHAFCSSYGVPFNHIECVL
jgi:hypothetical protein